MHRLALAALILGAASSSAAALASPPPLCRVTAVTYPIAVPPLRSITLTLRPGCPADGQGNVRLRSSFGATDPPLNGVVRLTLTRPTVMFNGVLPNWYSEWVSQNGTPYRIPENRP